MDLCRWPDHLNQPIDARHARLRVGSVEVQRDVDPKATRAVFEVQLQAGPARLQSWLTTPAGKERGAYYVYVERLE